MKCFLYLTGFVLLLSNCRNAPETSEIEQQLTEENQERLNEAQPPVRLSWSLERENINRRTELWNDTNKISYIYLLHFNQVLAEFSIRGKVSSVNSQVTNPEQIARIYKKARSSGWDSFSGVLPSPAEDGSYGTNGNAIFFFTEEGNYIEWNGEYLLSDVPLRLNVQPLIAGESEIEEAKEIKAKKNEMADDNTLEEERSETE